MTRRYPRRQTGMEKMLSGRIDRAAPTPFPSPENRAPKLGQVVEDYNWGGFSPYDHQRTTFYRSRDREFYAFLMEQRTGKSALVVHEAAYRKAKGDIDAVLIVAPNDVKWGWEEEFRNNAPEWLEYDLLVWQASAKHEKMVRAWRPNGTLRVLVMNEEAFATKRGQDVAAIFLDKHRTYMAIDESTAIANPRAKRTKALHKLRKMAVVRRILTGTPVSKSPLDVWSQFFFLEPDILGPNYYAFRNRYSVMATKFFNGRTVEVPVDFVNVDQIQQRLSLHSTRVTRDQVHDAPPKVYQKIHVELDRAQRRIYNDMRDEMLAEWEGKILEVTQIITQLLRLQQITGGFVPAMGENKANPLPGKNQKIEALLTFLTRLQDEKVVIYARFRAEIEAIVVALRQQYGEDAAVPFYGDVKMDERREHKRQFQDASSPVRFIVANPVNARMGQDFSRASALIYYSNDFGLLTRLQSEDRAETIRFQKGSTLVVDMISRDTMDEKVVQVLRDKKSLADAITGDSRLKDWL